MTKVTLKIKGMNCASCAITIEKAIREKKGVVKANVNFASEKASLEFDSDKINLTDIQKIIKELDYSSEQETSGETGGDEHAQKNSQEIRSLRNRFWGSLFLGLPLFYLVMGKIVGLPVPQLSLKLTLLSNWL